jgi:hypothetical protein
LKILLQREKITKTKYTNTIIWALQYYLFKRFCVKILCNQHEKKTMKKIELQANYRFLFTSIKHQYTYEKENLFYAIEDLQVCVV